MSEADVTVEEKTKAGQRLVNMMWETMQALIALGTVGATLFVASKLSLMALETNSTERQIAFATMAFMLISNQVSLVIGFYFGRTNHQKTGGVGLKDEGR